MSTRQIRGPFRATMPDLVAASQAGLTMLAAVGWLSIPLHGGGLQSSVATSVLVISTAAVGVLAYVITTRLLARSMRPLREAADLVRTAALQPRDHIRFLRHRIASTRVSSVAEVDDLLAALSQFAAKVEQRHARQTGWIAAVVHDVKTPIVGASNALSTLSRAPSIRDLDEAQWLRRIGEELRVLSRDVHRLVDAVRFEREDVELARDEVDLRDVLDAIVSRLEPRQGVSVCVRGMGSVRGDRTLLGRALENLLTNAIRYARSVVEVDIHVGLVRVADDGEGLPAPFEVLAQPFRSEASTVAGVAAQGGAAGIGLFLARRVLELHGGRLVVESTGSRGTAFLAYIGSLTDG